LRARCFVVRTDQGRSQIFRKQHFFRGVDNEDQLLQIVRVLGSERFNAYLDAYRIRYKSHSGYLRG
jgi:casein kinase II subunit alpha